MSKWKMVPVELTPEMFRAMAGAEGCEGRYSVAIAAAPEWEPSDEDVERAFDAEAEAFAECVADGTVMEHGQHAARRISIRAAIKAAVGGHDDH